MNLSKYVFVAIVCALTGCPELPSADGGGAGSESIPKDATCGDLVAKIERLAEKKGCVEDDVDDLLEECECPAYRDYLACLLSQDDGFMCGSGGDLKENRDIKACVDTCNSDSDTTRQSSDSDSDTDEADGAPNDDDDGEDGWKMSGGSGDAPSDPGSDSDADSDTDEADGAPNDADDNGKSGGGSDAAP